MKRFVLFVVIIISLSSCKKDFLGNEGEELLPQTYTVIDTIIRQGNNRFTTKIEINWWGTSPQGYIKGYEISFDNKNWTFTEKQDSIFFLPIPQGNDTFDFTFYVRALDNKNRRDASPAILTIPVKNSPPSVKFIVVDNQTPLRNPVKSFPVLKYSWRGSDPDGNENIEYYELYINDTSNKAYQIDATHTSMIIKAQNPSKIGISKCDVYLGINTIVEKEKMKGLKINDYNYLIIRAVDKVGFKSEFDTSMKVFVQPKKSNILLINAYKKDNFGTMESKENFYKNNLNAIGKNNYDILRIFDTTIINQKEYYTQMPANNKALSLILDMYEGIIWFGKDSKSTLPLAQSTTDNFFTKGGKLFINCEIEYNIAQTTSYLEFLGIDSLVHIENGWKFILNKDSILIPSEVGYPYLETSQILGLRPYWKSGHSSSLYSGQLMMLGTGVKNWSGNSDVMHKRQSKGKTNLIFFSQQLDMLNKRNNSDSLFKKVIIDEFAL